MFSRTSAPTSHVETPHVNLRHQILYAASRKRRTIACCVALCSAAAFAKPVFFSEPEQLVQVAVFDGDYAAHTTLEPSMWHLAEFPARLAPNSPLDLSGNSSGARLAHDVVAGQPVTSNTVTSASAQQLRDGEVLVALPHHPDAPFPPVRPGDKVVVTALTPSPDGRVAGEPISWTAFVARSQPDSSQSNNTFANKEGKPPLHLKISRTFLNNTSTVGAPSLIRVALVP